VNTLDALLDAASLLDALIVFVVLACGVLGYHRKLSGEVAPLLCHGAALFCALRYGPDLAERLAAASRLSGASAGAFLIAALLVGAFVAALLLRRILRGFFRRLLDPRADHRLGIPAGTLRAAAVAVMLLMLGILCPQPFLNRQAGDGSAIGRVLRARAPLLQLPAEPVEPETPADTTPEAR
jgi:uncharacterized membrane protein required for colicin V production